MATPATLTSVPTFTPGSEVRQVTDAGLTVYWYARTLLGFDQIRDHMIYGCGAQPRALGGEIDRAMLVTYGLLTLVRPAPGPLLSKRHQGRCMTRWPFATVNYL